MKENLQKIVVITGPSGSGKTSVIDQLVKDHPELKKVLLYTTREKRKGETNLDRKFVSNEKFDGLYNDGELACIKIHGENKYAVPKDIDNNFNIMDLDPDGLKKLKNEISANIIPIVLYQPPEVCEERMRNRGDSEENIQSRLDYDSKRFDDIKKIINLVEEDLVHAVCCPRGVTVKATADVIWDVLKDCILS